MRRLVGWAVVGLAALFLGFAAFVRLAADEPDFWHVDPLITAPIGNSNSWRVGPDAGSVAFDAPAPIFDIGAGELAAAFDAIAVAAPRVTRLAGTPDDLWMTYVQRSRLMAFPDYLSVRIIPLDEGGSTLAIYSRSRFGRSDLGVNRARVEKWLAALSEHAA